MAELTRCSKCGGQMNIFSTRVYDDKEMSGPIRVRKYRCMGCGAEKVTDEPFVPVDVVEFVNERGICIRQISGKS
jgi:hypothetical protein